MLKSRYSVISNTIKSIKKCNAELIIRVFVALHNDSIIRGKMHANLFDQSQLMYNCITSYLYDDNDQEQVTTRNWLFEYLTSNKGTKRFAVACCLLPLAEPSGTSLC